VYRLYISLICWPRKGKKKRKGGRVTRARADNDTIESKKTQRQRHELNQHNMPLSPSSLSSPERAPTKGEKKNRDQNQRGHHFHCPQKQWPSAVCRSFNTIVFVYLSYQRGRERKHRKWDRKEENKGNEIQKKNGRTQTAERKKPITSRPGKLFLFSPGLDQWPG
jgi:hypothetical protein